MNCRPRPYQGRALPLSYGGVGKAYAIWRKTAQGVCAIGRQTRNFNHSSWADDFVKVDIISELGDSRTVMTDTDIDAPKDDASQKAKEARKRNDRLTALLRANLLKRKAQSRARDTQKPDNSSTPDC